MNNNEQFEQNNKQELKKEIKQKADQLINRILNIKNIENLTIEDEGKLLNIPLSLLRNKQELIKKIYVDIRNIRAEAMNDKLLNFDEYNQRLQSYNGILAKFEYIPESSEEFDNLINMVEKLSKSPQDSVKKLEELVFVEYTKKNYQ